VTWISKALKSFRKAASSIMVKGVNIPKYVVFNETYKIKQALNTSKAAKANLNESDKNFKKLETHVLPDLL
jgi:hypothetical protein